jgi:uncharacterized hydrophobic protein (TIGR00271 family)
MGKIQEFLNLHSGEEDKDKVLENVIANTSFRGSNFWILACAILIASVGLNVNSTAVIIGAMLISPLMGPIIGTGFALGTFNFPLLKKSLKNLLIATLLGLLVSTFYFLISPFKEEQSEILARTSPNIYDVLIAFFGGVVGAIAITRTEKGNPIPGVAIATALMPPLCTAGYGLAISNISYFFGALFLYAINCVFIAIATFAIVKYLKYPTYTYIEPKREKMVRNIVYALTLIMILPSLYFAYSLFEEKRYSQNVEKFINQEFSDKDYTIIYKKINLKSTPKTLDVACLNKQFTADEIASLKEDLLKFGLKDLQLNVKQDILPEETNINELNEFYVNNIESKDKQIEQLKEELAMYNLNTEPILNEIKVFFPQINSISLATHKIDIGNEMKSIVVCLYNSNTILKKDELDKLQSWLKERLKAEVVVAYSVQ